MWLIILLYHLAGLISPVALGRVNSTLSYDTPACFNGDHLANCRDTFFNATNFVPVGSSEAFCKLEAAFSLCLEAAVCTCQYPASHTFLENSYKDLMRNDYDFVKYSCQKFNTGYWLKPGITCTPQSRNFDEHYQINQTTAEQPFIISLKENCSAIGTCFTNRDRDFEVALYNKNLSQYCSNYDIFLKCFELKACECNMQEDQSMLLVDGFEKRLYSEMCSIITGSQTVIPEIACEGVCSLSDPGVTCTQEFERNIAESKGDEDFCRHLITYANCYERLVCECTLYQRQSVYMAVTIAKYTFEVRSNCKQFPGLVFPSIQNGFPCPNDTKIPESVKILNLTTSQDDFVQLEAPLCPGVIDCFSKFDTDGSVALNRKDLKAFCQAMSEEIQCLEEIVCGCGIFHSRFANVFRAKRGALDSVCGQDVIVLPPPLVCVDQSVCTLPEPLDVCNNIHSHHAENTNSVQCESYLSRGQCIKNVACSCGFISNGSSISAAEIYKLLNSNAAIYDNLGCLSSLNKSESGLECSNSTNKEQTDKFDKKLNLTWSQSSDKAELVSLCPSIKTCFEQDDVINEEALFAFDHRRVCRNRRNTIKCMEKSFCECGLDKDESKTAALQEKFISHNMECSKYAPIGNSNKCNEDSVCTRANTTDVCLNRLTNKLDSIEKCSEYTAYLFCLFDVACSCNLVMNSSEVSVEKVYRNVTKVLYLMLSHQCSLQSLPVSLFQQELECFDTISALPIKTDTLKLVYAKDPSLQQLQNKCQAIITCANNYDEQLTQALMAKDQENVCLSTQVYIRCSKRVLTGCNMLNSSEAVSFIAALIDKHQGCPENNLTETDNVTETGNVTETDNVTEASASQSSNFGSDALVNTNSTQSRVETVPREKVKYSQEDYKKLNKSEGAQVVYHHHRS